MTKPTEQRLSALEAVYPACPVCGHFQSLRPEAMAISPAVYEQDCEFCGQPLRLVFYREQFPELR